MIKLSCVVAEITNDMEKGGKATLKVADASKKCYSTSLYLGFDAADGVKDLTVGEMVAGTVTPAAVVTTGRDPLVAVELDGAAAGFGFGGGNSGDRFVIAGGNAQDAERMPADAKMDRGGLERIDK